MDVVRDDCYGSSKCDPGSVLGVLVGGMTINVLHRADKRWQQ
jgi:hypothetical protein